MQSKGNYSEKSKLVGKRIWVTDEVNRKVFKHKKLMELKSGGELQWEDAAQELLDKATRNIKLHA